MTNNSRLFHARAAATQGRSQKFVLEGISLPHKKFTWADFFFGGGVINTDIHPRRYAPAATVKARSPIVLRRVTGTTTAVDELERKRRLRLVSTSAARSSYAVCLVDWCCAVKTVMTIYSSMVKTPEDEGRQLESDPLQNPELVEFLEQRRHVIEIPDTGNNPSSGMEDGLQPKVKQPWKQIGGCYELTSSHKSNSTY